MVRSGVAHSDSLPDLEVVPVALPFRRALSIIVVAMAIAVDLAAQEVLVMDPDSPRWTLAGQARVDEFLGRRCLMLDGATASINGFTMQDGVIDLDVATAASRGFFGVQFRGDSLHSEFVYLRQHKSGAPDAMQYTPVLNTGLNWQLFSGPGFTGRVDIPRNTWFHLRLEVTGANAKLYVGDTTTPVLVMPDLKSGLKNGEVGLAVLTGATCFANVRIRTTPPAPWRRDVPAMPAGVLTRWSLSPSMDALARDLERPLSDTERASMTWQEVEAEYPGIVAINRYRPSPHPRVTFQSDFSTRLNPQPGTMVVYARTIIPSDRDQIRKLFLGYSDEVTVFLNGSILYRGRSAQSFRDPAFLGIVDAENDAVFLPLRRGENELMLAVAELGGGWGFVGRLAP